MYGQHGSAEHGGRSRGRSTRSVRSDRSRDRSERSQSEQLPQMRSGPAGPQERMEWLDALQDCKTRIQQLEANNRSLAQKAAEHDHYFKVVADDIAAYKVWMNGVIFHDDKSIDSKFKVVERRVEDIMNSSAEIISTTCSKLDETQSRLEPIERAVNTFNEWVS